MKYKFDLKIQLLYGIFGFLFVLVIVYLLTKDIDWFSSIAIGLFNFAVSGFYVNNYKRCDVKPETNDKKIKRKK